MRRSLVAAVCALGLGTLGEAQAAEPRGLTDQKVALPPGAYSPYEQQTMARALIRRGVTVDLAPEGKVIEDVAIDVLDVLEDRDPLPSFLNLFHTTTRDRAIRRDLLFKRGERYERAVIQETERNLRALRQLSLVLIVPIRGSVADRVRVLVLAKDVWSLRLNTGYRITGSGVEYFLVEPSEENLTGMQRVVSGAFSYDPATISVGGRFTEPRLADSRYLISAGANAIINHATGEVEGSFGSFEYGLPLFSTRQRWAWGASVSWRREHSRRFSGRNIGVFNADAAADPQNLCPNPRRCIPLSYKSDVLSGSVSVTRSFGSGVKHDLQLGVAADRRAFTPSELSGYDSDVASGFIDKHVPLSDRRNSPYLLYHGYTNRYTQLVDVETLGLQESFRVGAEGYARVYPIFEALGSARNLLGHTLSAAFTVPFRDGLTRLYAAGAIEGWDRVVNASLQGGVRIVSPKFVVGRLIYDGTFNYRVRNQQRSVASLGGDGRLRGYLSGLILGENLFASNLEFRSRPVQLWTSQLGGALFYDVGDAFDSLATLRPKQSAGFGVRLGFPQLQRSVMRIDLGFPLTAGVPKRSVVDGLIVTFDQAFGMPVLASSGIGR